MKKIIAGVLIILAGAAIGLYLKYPVFSFHGDAVLPAPEQPAQKPLVAVSIDNDPAARPQSGLAAADVVIETLAEGGVTRFLAFFQQQEAPLIGPVRSARPYFVDWALGEGAMLAHSGGSKEALEKIAATPGIRDANEFYNEHSFWRDKTKSGPHNLFTSTDMLWQLAEKKNWSPLLPFLPLEGGGQVGVNQSQEQVSSIIVNFSYPLFATTFTYDPATQTYERKQTGSPKLTPANVVILYTESTVIDQNLLTLDLRTTGSGKAVIFRGGAMEQARWKKDRAGSPLELLEADNTKVVLGRGQTWIAVIDQRGSASWK